MKLKKLKMNGKKAAVQNAKKIHEIHDMYSCISSIIKEHLGFENKELLCRFVEDSENSSYYGPYFFLIDEKNSLEPLEVLDETKKKLLVLNSMVGIQYIRATESTVTFFAADGKQRCKIAAA